MARKRVSLKDKGPETLGLTEKKGKGIDVLFGGPAASTTRPSSESAATPSKTKQPKTEVTNMTAENKDALTNPISDVAAPPPPVIESLPVNEADDHLGSATSGGDDDLGLPVAMEAPPAVIASADLGAREVDELGLPVALETPPTDMTMPVSPTPPPIETAPSAEAFPRPVDTNDLSGLAGEDDDLSGLAGEEAGKPSAAPTVDTTPTVVTPPIEVPSISAVPSAPMTGAPFVESAPVPPPLVTPEPAIPRPVPAPPPVETPVYTPPPSPVTYTPPPVPATPPPPRIESFGGIVTEALPTRIEDLLPQDYQYDTGMVQLAERAKVERDDLLSEKVARYIGKERREALDHEIERLYDVVSSELSDNNEDVSYALKALSEAQDIVLEDIRQYDEALYRVAMVKTMLARRRNLKRWSYTWGSFVFVYAIVWLALFITAIVLTGNINSTVQRFAGQSEGLVAASTAWYSALAGGIGGVIGILYSLYWRVAVKQNFDRQYLMYYLVQPIMGFMLGAVTHLIITAGFLTFNAAGATSDITVILQMVIGFIAGFRQRLVYEMIDKIVQKIAPEESDKSPTSVVPEQ